MKPDPDEEQQMRRRLEALQKAALNMDAAIASISGETVDGEPFAAVYAHGEAAATLKRWIEKRQRYG